MQNNSAVDFNSSPYGYIGPTQTTAAGSVPGQSQTGAGGQPSGAFRFNPWQPGGLSPVVNFLQTYSGRPAPFAHNYDQIGQSLLPISPVAQRGFLNSPPNLSGFNRNFYKSDYFPKQSGLFNIQPSSRQTAPVQQGQPRPSPAPYQPPFPGAGGGQPTPIGQRPPPLNINPTFPGAGGGQPVAVGQQPPRSGVRPGYDRNMFPETPEEYAIYTGRSTPTSTPAAAPVAPATVPAPPQSSPPPSSGYSGYLPGYQVALQTNPRLEYSDYIRSLNNGRLPGSEYGSGFPGSVGGG